MRQNKMTRLYIKVVMMLVLFSVAGLALAHGERNQEPFLRMKTLHWYDIKWSIENDSTVQVNEEVTMTGKVHFFSRWPEQINMPDTVFLANATPGPVFVRVGTWLNDVPMIQSTGVEVGRVYDFKVVLKARIPGRHHVHPMFNVESAGGLVGPGIWMNIAGDANDFLYGVETRTGIVIEDLETYGVENVVKWHAFWAILAVLWLAWWVRRPLLINRFLWVKDNNWSALITRTDMMVGGILLVFIITVLIVANQITEKTYPRTVPLQGGKVEVQYVPNPEEGLVEVKNHTSEYYLPGRTITIDATITNNTGVAVEIGEFMSSNLRFVNKKLPIAMAGVDEGYPAELVPNKGLILSDDSPIQPGESRRLRMEATDVAWETERLSSLLNDPDSSYGALIFFFDAEGNRYTSEIYGQILPTFFDK